MLRYCTVAVAIGFALMLPAAASADTFTVAAPTEAALQDAVEAANDREGADTVLLAGHTIMLADDHVNVRDDLTLRGPGTLDGSGLESDAIIEAWANLTIDDVRLVDNDDDRALLVLAPADVRVERSTFTGNDGAIGVYPSEPTVAARGAQQLADGSLVVTDTTFEGNVEQYGGAIDIDPGQSTNIQVAVARSTFAGNRAVGEGTARGGAINIWGGTLSVENSTFSGNSAAGPNFGSGGGAIAVSGFASTTLTHVTITGNLAEGQARGGGIAGPRFEGLGAQSFVPVTVVNSIVAGNTSEVIEDDRAAAALAVQADDCDFPVGTLGGNLEGDTTCGFRGAGDKQNTDPKLAALAANGGLTRTHALAADSPAVNMAGAARCLATDQRGMPRVATACDSGAYELVPPGTQPSAPAGGALGEQASNCLSDRRFKIRLRVPRGEEVRKAIVKVNGKRVKVKRGKRLTAIVDLRGLTKERYKVNITLRLKGGGKVTGVRRYWTCTPAIRWTKPPKV